MSSNQYPVTSNISQLIRILVDNLQADPYAPVREYISNAYDACLTIPNSKIYINGEGGNLIILDEGIGMTKDIIFEAFTRIGGSFKNQEDLATIGMFGIGVLSAFIAAKKLIVETRHIHSNKAWRLEWIRYEEKFTLEESEKESHGTKVTMVLDEKHVHHLGQNYEIEGHIGETFALLNVPIYIGKPTTSFLANPLCHWLNSIGEGNIAPRLLSHSDAHELMAKFSHIDLHSIYYTAKEDGTKIFLGIPNDVFEPLDRHSVKFFSKGVHIQGDLKEFYPKNLAFVVGLIDSPNFKLQITREKIFTRDAHFTCIRQEMEHHIIAFLQMITAEGGYQIESVLSTHHRMLVAHAYSDQRLIALFKNHYKFMTSSGELYWREILPFATKNSKHKIIYVTSSELKTIKDFTTTTATKGFLTVYALGAEKSILEKIALTENVIIKDAQELEQDGTVVDVPEPFRKLANAISQHLGRMGMKGTVFINLPADAQYPSVLRIKTIEGKRLLGTPFADNFQVPKSYDADALMLNISNALIRNLAGKKGLKSKQYGKIAEILFETAWLHSPFSTMRQELSDEIINNLMKCIELQVDLKDSTDDLESGQANCFVALPYADEYLNVWEGANQVLSMAPYNWNPIRADRNVKGAILIENIQKNIKSSKRFLADLSGLNMNVLIEIGIMLENNSDRLLIMCDNSTFSKIPVDLRGRLLLRYPDELRVDKNRFAEFFKNKIVAFQDWVALAGNKEHSDD